MTKILKLHSEYLETITKFKLDPIILLMSVTVSSNLREAIIAYMILLVAFHIPFIILNTVYNEDNN